ncbi:MAG: hypothetical protein COX91_01345 [Candidatus Nealsonbacteria bacterium CG_4_10_14_0_2_um_filter_39_15]|uniref:Uncharacterized protein n=1 Tax=Candidatus Nealsonbacteria bacterium CG_4_10_14_0_2_um_filter_39_15 TaxID=1974681 RepID=A0A2M7UW68_9BACT|nr:MAG: hypothetical protein COX91_01345 [Candidatus Nealsonbacteria bacterium CG_4_10_14_0_2_um_filter_39_15]
MLKARKQCYFDSLSGALASKKVTEAFKGRLTPDGNRSDRAKPKAGFTARRICRAVGKPELSEPTDFYRKSEDHQPKATSGITGW